MKKGFLVLLIAVVCLFSVGCGKDDEKSSKSSKNVQTLKCTQDEDGNKMEVSISQNKKTYELTEGKMTMTMDLSDYGEAAASMDWEQYVCTEESYKDCSAKVDGSTLTVNIELDMTKYAEELKEDGDIKDLNEDTLNELKESAEKDGATCKIS